MGNILLRFFNYLVEILWFKSFQENFGKAIVNSHYWIISTNFNNANIILQLFFFSTAKWFSLLYCTYNSLRFLGIKNLKKLGPDEHAQLKRGKSVAVMNIECAKFVVANGCKCGKNAQWTMFVYTPRTYS